MSSFACEKLTIYSTVPVCNMYYVPFLSLPFIICLMISHAYLGLLGHIGPPGIFNFALMNKQRGIRGRCSPAGSAALTLLFIFTICYHITPHDDISPSDGSSTVYLV